MILRSNIAQVIGRLKRLEAGIPEAVKEAIAPTYWKGRLEHVALQTLRAQWALERDLKKRQLYERLTPRIIATLTSEMLGMASRFTLEIPESMAVGGLNVQAAIDYKLAQLTPAGRTKKFAISEPDQEEHLESVRQAIRDWVMLEKKRDERDEGLTDEQIAERIEEILGLSDRAIPRERTPLLEESATSLVRAINDWLAGAGDTPPVQRDSAAPAGLTIDPETAASWMQAVLLAWCSYVQTHLLDRLELTFGKLHRRIQTELL